MTAMLKPEMWTTLEGSLAYQRHVCDLCGADEPREIECLREYSGGQPIHVCLRCGLVYVVARRPQAAINYEWESMYGDAYDPDSSEVAARHCYVGSEVQKVINWHGKSVIDLGAGNGEFLEEISNKYGPDHDTLFAVEPTHKCCEALKERDIDHCNSTVENFLYKYQAWDGGPDGKSHCVRQWDIATLLWTLENSVNPRDTLIAAREMVKPIGHLVVATGSRILVPFKKSLSSYIGPKNPADTHPTRWSANTLCGILTATGWKPVHINPHQDSMYLVVIATPAEPMMPTLPCDNSWHVEQYFMRWDADEKSRQALWGDERYYTGR